MLHNGLHFKAWSSYHTRAIAWSRHNPQSAPKLRTHGNNAPQKSTADSYGYVRIQQGTCSTCIYPTCFENNHTAATGQVTFHQGEHTRNHCPTRSDLKLAAVSHQIIFPIKIRPKSLMNHIIGKQRSLVKHIKIKHKRELLWGILPGVQCSIQRYHHFCYILSVLGSVKLGTSEQHPHTHIMQRQDRSLQVYCTLKWMHSPAKAAVKPLSHQACMCMAHFANADDPTQWLATHRAD